MYSVIKVRDAIDHLDSLERKGFRLCYVEGIDPEIWSWGEENPEPKVNPNYDPNRGTHMAYFSDAPFDKIWGDDWDDAPYEYNAEIPYDHWTDDQGKRKECAVISIPFGWDNSDALLWKLPRDYGDGNSSWSVVDINAGQIPWLWCGRVEFKKFPEHTSLSGGASVKEFLQFLSNVEKLKKKYEN